MSELVTSTATAPIVASNRGPRPKAEPLTVKQIDAAKPAAEEYRLTDGGHRGLTLFVMPGGAKVWRAVYTSPIDGKRKLAKFGEYPPMSLRDARVACLELRNQVERGVDPNQAKATAKAERIEANAQTVEVMARQWHALKSQGDRGWKGAYATQMMQRLEAHVFPAIGAMPLIDVRRKHVLDLLECCYHKRNANKQGGAFQADHVRQHLVKFFDYAIDKEWLPVTATNPADRLSEHTETPKGEGQPAVQSIEAAREVLAKLEASSASTMLKLMHRFGALVGMRPSEVREAQWAELTEADQVWTIPANRMKGRRGRTESHTVYLSPQAAEVIAVARELARPGAVFVFPSEQSGAAYNRSSLSARMKEELAVEGEPDKRIHVAHGWRSAMSTLLNDWHGEASQTIETMLAHQTKGQVKRAYDRTATEAYRSASAVSRARETALAATWGKALLEGARSAWALAGLPEPATNVVAIGRAA